MNDILLIEDNLEFIDLIEKLLEKRGFSFCHKTSGELGLEWLEKNQVRVVILDIMLKGIDGFAVCEKIRKKKNIPIIILSAKSNKTDKLMGFSLGADDYIEKPVDLDILTAKLKVLINRYDNKDSINSNNLKIDLSSHKVYLNDKKLELNVKEFALLVLFVENKGKTLYKQYIFDKIWGLDSFSEEQTLTVHVKMLRNKIEKDPRNPKIIQTVWGVGYRYEEI